MPIRLIVNSDDYGRTPEISRGIRTSHLHGLVTSSTAMMNMPSVAADLRLALAETPGLGLGVHLVLTAGKPLLPPEKVRSLVDVNGKFLRLEPLIEKAAQLDPAEVKAEWRTQIEAFCAAAGKNPTHLDSHHHTSYITPGVFQSMLELAREFALPVRLPVSGRGRTTLEGIPAPLNAAMRAAAPQLLTEFQPRHPDGFFDTFYDETATRDEIRRILDSLPSDGDFEIMCHPGFVDEAFARESSYAWQRQREFEVLTDPAMRAEIDQRGIQLIHFAQL